MRDYRASVDLAPTADGGTTIHWHGTYQARWGLGRLTKRVLPRVTQQMADGLAAHASTLTE
ncbi:SRPBCC family protein [Actinosynnema sp. CA-248983]